MYIILEKWKNFCSLKIHGLNVRIILMIDMCILIIFFFWVKAKASSSISMPWSTAVKSLDARGRRM